MHSIEWLSAFWRYVLPEPNSGCWLWDGYISESGYGRFSPKWKMAPFYAHRYSYEIYKGPIPAGMTIDHLCRVRCCVNPDHLEPVSYAENIRRGLLVELRAPRTHCKVGHELKDGDFYWRRSHKICLVCDRARNKLKYQRKRAVDTSPTMG